MTKMVFASKGWVRVKVKGKRPGAGYGKKEEKQRWWIRFDDGRSYSVPGSEVEPEVVPLVRLETQDTENTEKN